jgi:hypothetical protein
MRSNQAYCIILVHPDLVHKPSTDVMRSNSQEASQMNLHKQAFYNQNWITFLFTTIETNEMRPDQAYYSLLVYPVLV